MNTVRCKFVCNSKEEVWNNYNKNDDGTIGRKEYSYKFSAVTGGSEENKTFWAYTPCGQFSVQTVLVDQFQPGKEYYLDISEAF